VWVRSYELSAADEVAICPHHARAVLQYHLVLATFGRRGVFGDASAEAVACVWRAALGETRAALLTVSFLPDHVHVALRAHPGVSPAELAAGLMNSAQEVIWRQFPDDAIRAGVERLWQPSAYLGSYGELESPKIRQYIRNWEADG
jgi:REP element-mobilizing transposase RayT